VRENGGQGNPGQKRETNKKKRLGRRNDRGFNDENRYGECAGQNQFGSGIQPVDEIDIVAGHLATA
jgi:hypothetical protein